MRIAILALMAFNLSAQSNGDTLKNGKLAYAEGGFYASTGPYQPFWARSNQYGTIDGDQKAFATLRGGYYQNIALSKGFTATGGVNAVINAGNKVNFILPEAFGQVNYKKMQLYVGRKREVFGLVDTTLTSGSYIWSGNALPLPKIELAWRDYRPIMKNGFIALKGSYAHGWFGKQNYVSNFFLHQKTLYGRIGKPNSKLHLYGGFNHQVQWGGTSQIANKDGKFEKYPSNFLAYTLVSTGFSLIRLGQWGLIDQSKFPYNEAYNRVGNHLGSIDLGFDLNLKDVKLNFYRQNLYDDGSLYYLANLEDGLNGVSILLKKGKTIKKLTFEYLNTSDQGHCVDCGNTTDNDNYFNNSYYSWINQSNTIGTPFITGQKYFNNTKPSTLDNYLYNNKVSVLSLMASGEIRKISYVIGASNNLSFKSAGINKGDPIKNQSYFLNAAYRILKNDVVMAKISLDKGSLYPEAFGLGFVYRKHLR